MSKNLLVATINDAIQSRCTTKDQDTSTPPLFSESFSSIFQKTHSATEVYYEQRTQYIKDVAFNQLPTSS